MTFRITGLPADRFAHLQGLPDARLREMNIERRRVDANPGFPDRISLRDAEVGESVLLLNYMHHPAATPYRASHAIFIIEGESRTCESLGEMPAALARRTLSLRAFDEAGMMLDADLAEGAEAAPVIERLFRNPQVAYLHAHYAKRGCYAARVDRA